MDRPLLEALGRRIRRRREARSWTLAELAVRAGLAAADLAAVEAGTADPRFTTLRRLARALDLPLAALFED